MTIVSLTDCCRSLSIDPKTLRRWLASAPFTLQPHHAHRQGLTQDQLCWLAQAHHRSLAMLPQEAPLPTPVPSIEALTLPEDLRQLLQALSALPAQLAALQEQLADLSQQFSHLPEAATTTRSRAGGTSKAAGRSRRRTKSRSQSQRPSQAQVLALVEYAGEGHYVVISPKGGLLPFEPDSPSWFAWLSTCVSFRFVGKLGRLTAHREIERVRKGTWRAHRQIRNHTYNVRLGVTEELTIAALEQAAATLHAHL